MSLTKSDLMDLKEEIDEAKEKKTKLEARRDLLQEQLKEKWKVNNLKEADLKQKQLSKEISQWDEKIKTASAELEKKLTHDDEGTEE